MSDPLDRLKLSALALARLRHLLGRVGALPESPAPAGPLLGPHWRNPQHALTPLLEMLPSLAPFTIEGAQRDEDDVPAVRLLDGKGRPLAIRADFDAEDRFRLVSWSRPAPAGVTIRRATEADVPALAALEADCPIQTAGGGKFRVFRPHFAQLLRLQGGGDIWVADRAGRLVAMRGVAYRDACVGGAPLRFAFSQFAVVRPEERGHNLLQCFFRYTAEDAGRRTDYMFAHMDEGNEAIRPAFRSTTALDWRRRAHCLAFEADSRSAPFGREAIPADAARIAELLDAAHGGKAMYREATAESVAERLSRDPRAYGWRHLLIGERAVVGAWLSGEEWEDRTPAGVTTRRWAAVLDYGFEGEAGLAELVRLLGAWRARAAAAGATHLSLYTSNECPEYAALAPLAAGEERFVFSTRLPEPEPGACRGLYTDALFI